MKTILLFIALTGFTAAGSYAQNKGCASHKTAAKKTAHKVITPRVPANEPDPTCFTLRKENLGIPGCVNATYGSSNAYMGYYPKNKTTTKVMKEERETAINTKMRTPQYKPVDNEPMKPCYTYNHNDIKVMECPSDFYDNAKEPLTAAPVIMEYNSVNSWMGNYPNYSKKDETKMENKEIDGLHLPDQDLHFWNK